MAFKEEIQKLSAQILQRKEHIQNEETTKHSLIIPFIQVLGYDIFNPLEVRPEFVADFGNKKGEKVDYAISKNDKPIMFIEAKSVTEKLDNHDAQLSRYFNSSPDVKLGILTNGIKYKLFTDLNENNIMDTNPFFEFDFDNINDQVISTLQRFSKDLFEVSEVIVFAEELVYMSNLTKNLKELFKNPSDDFIRLLVKDFSKTKITNSVIERFKPIVKKAITSTILEIVSQGILQAEINESAVPSLKECNEETISDENVSKPPLQSKIITTSEELKSFGIVKKILISAGKDIDNVNFKDTVSYFGIFKRNINGWFLRISLDGSFKYITTRIPVEDVSQLCKGFKIEPAPKGMGESRIIINDYTDIEKLNDLIIWCFENIENN